MSVCLPTKIAEAEATTEHSIQTYTASACAASREGAYLRGAPTPEKSARACVCAKEPTATSREQRQALPPQAFTSLASPRPSSLREHHHWGGCVCVCLCVCVCAGAPTISSLEHQLAWPEYFAEAASRAAQHLEPGATLAARSRRPQQHQAWKAAPGSALSTQILIDAHIPTVPSTYLLFAGQDRT